MERIRYISSRTLKVVLCQNFLKSISVGSADVCRQLNATSDYECMEQILFITSKKSHTKNLIEEVKVKSIEISFMLDVEHFEEELDGLRLRAMSGGQHQVKVALVIHLTSKCLALLEDTVKEGWCQGSSIKPTLVCICLCLYL